MVGSYDGWRPRAFLVKGTVTGEVAKLGGKAGKKERLEDAVKKSCDKQE